MNGKRSDKLALLGISTGLMMGLVGCGPRADDINQVQPGYVRKSIFQNDSEWHYRRTVVKSETTNQYVVEGSGDIFAMERVKWRIEENTLLAYRPYETIPGTDKDEYENSTEFEGTTLAAFPIISHFDIQRGYDPTTGNETNIVSENASDRPWTAREYMRVDWSTDLVSKLGGGYSYADNAYEFPLQMVTTDTYWSDLDTRPTDEFASRFSDDYVEVTHNSFVAMDLITCLGFLGWSTAAYDMCSFGEAKVRHSFARVNTKSDFIPRNYPDSIVRKDADGNAMTDPVTGEVVREPIYNRFGIFRREIPTYDRGYGLTESGKIYRAMMFNIWERHTDDQGNEIPCDSTRCDRTPKPIVYYMNAEFPARWRKAAAETAAEYDRVFKGLVTDLVGAGRTPEHMYEIRENSCSENNVKSFVANNPDLQFAVARAVCSEGEACNDPMNMVKFGNLTKVCTSLEAATRDPATGKSTFDWQRDGDARYNMLVYLNNPQMSGWGGFGPMRSDSRTGETLSATSYIRGHFYELTASNIVDYIELINDEKSVEEIIYGQDIRKHIAAVQKRGADIVKRPGNEFTSLMENRLSRFGSTKEQMLRQVEPNHQINRLKRSEGTRIDDQLASNWQDMALASLQTSKKWRPGDEISPELREALSPANRLTRQNPTGSMQSHTRAHLRNAGFCFLNYELDPHWAGLAIAMQGVPKADRYQIIAEKLLKHVFLHELGHNVGLSHNFEGTYDALNYNDIFWNSYIGGSPEDQLNDRIEEHRHTTVMEYIGQGKAAFGDYLGKYDEAAIRFVYGNQVQTFASAAVDPELAGGDDLRQWRYMNDYSKIPDHLCGTSGCADDDARRQVLRDRTWVDFDPQSPPQNEVPYLFCDNTYDGYTPFCSTFDYGSNLREIFANYHNRWSNYFFFTNFLRDRLSPFAWSPNSAIYPAMDALGFVNVVGQYLYFMQAHDANFSRTDLGQDMLATVGRGMNMAAEIMSTPEPLRMCPWPGTAEGDTKVYIPYYYLDGCDQFADLSSDYAITAEAIQLPLGDARPASLGFTEDLEDWDWAYVGSYFDKSNVMWLLGMNRPTFLRYSYELDWRTYDIGLYRIFEPELRNFFDKMVNLDPYLIEQSTAFDFGSYWCRDDDAPNVAHLGHFEPRKMVDPDSANPSLPGPSTQCRNPAVIMPVLLSNMPFNAMYYMHALYSSDWDSELDLGKAMKVYVHGAYDDFPDWDTLDPAQICTVTDIQTGLEYRSIHQPTGTPDIGCRLIARAEEAQDAYEQAPTNTNNKDRWRSWFERLEFARDLARIYDQQGIRIR